MDREYSLKPDDTSPRRVNLELGLGGDFDQSFGEALREGMGDREMELTQEALRALTEAKENLDERMGSKQGRKGSITMGLFRESSSSARAPVSRRRTGGTVLGAASPGVAEAIISEEEEDLEHQLVKEKARRRSKDKRERSATGGSVRSTGHSIRTGASRPPTPLIEPISEPQPRATSRRSSMDAARSVTSPDLSRRGTLPSAALGHSEDEEEELFSDTDMVAVNDHLPPSHLQSRRTSISPFDPTGMISYDEDSGWTTTSEESSLSDDLGSGRVRPKGGSSRSQSGSGSERDTLSDTDVEDEEEPMTVPLQPFGHAVGGHSSIYQFTRRAVCKVSYCIGQS